MYTEKPILGCNGVASVPESSLAGNDAWDTLRRWTEEVGWGRGVPFGDVGALSMCLHGTILFDLAQILESFRAAKISEMHVRDIFLIQNYWDS